MSNFEGVFKAAIKGMHDSNRKVYGPQLANVMKPGLEAMKPVFKLIYEKGLTDAIPEGCVVVPVEPTPKMIDSTWDDQDEIETMSHNTRNEFIYKKMIQVAALEAARSQS